MEVKTLAWTKAEHCPAALASHGVRGAPRIRPVNRRAARITPAYHTHAKEIDRALYAAGVPRPPAATGMGPAEQRIKSYGAILGLVWGHVGCASDDAHQLADLAGAEIARRTWRTSGAQTFLLSRAAQVSRVYRLWGLNAARARARASLAALGLVVGGQLRSGDPRLLQDVTLQRHQHPQALGYSLAAGPVIHSTPLHLRS